MIPDKHLHVLKEIFDNNKKSKESNQNTKQKPDIEYTLENVNDSGYTSSSASEYSTTGSELSDSESEYSITGSELSESESESESK